MNSYAQALRMLLQKAYPTGQKGSPEAESMGRKYWHPSSVPELKAKVTGSEGDFDTLLAKARLEEAKLRDLVEG